MKVSFHKDDTTQDPVRPAQVAMRDTPIRKWPIFKILVLCMAAVLGIYAAYRLYGQRTLFVYGMVAGPVQKIYMPFRGSLDRLWVHQGSPVKKGQLLFSVMPASLKEPAGREKASTDSTVGPEILKTRRMQQAKLQRARLEISRQQAAFQRAEAEYKSTFSKTRIEVQKLSEFYAGKEKRYNELAVLLKMDAAVSSQVDSAYNAMQLARHNLEQARVDFELAKNRNNPYKPTLKMARLHYETLLHENSSSTPNVLPLPKPPFKPAKALRFFASIDGVVSTININKGDFVLPGQLLAAVSDLKRCWLNAYVPPRKASSIHKGQPATLYIAGNPGGISGTVTARGIVVATPDALLEKMPDIRRSAYVRIDFQKRAGQSFLPGSIVKIVIEP